MSVSGRGCGRRLVAGFAVGGRLGHDRGEGRRRWRALDLGTTKAFVEADAPRVECHGVVVARVRRRRCANSCACRGTRSGGSPSASSSMSAPGRPTRSTRLRRIGIDELSYRVGQRYITVVVDHEQQGCWSGPRKAATKRQSARFFAELRPERSAGIELVFERHGRVDHPRGRRALPASDALPRPVPCRCARQRRPGRGTARGAEVWNEAQTFGRQRPAPAGSSGPRWALWKRPERLTERQQAKLATIEHVNHRLYRAYLLK